MTPPPATPATVTPTAITPSTASRPVATPSPGAGFPHRHGTNPAGTEHWIVACTASATVLERERRPDQARQLREAADQARAQLATDNNAAETAPVGTATAESPATAEISVSAGSPTLDTASGRTR
jgi:hypothetical protein